jgi:hypothetical protein
MEQTPAAPGSRWGSCWIPATKKTPPPADLPAFAHVLIIEPGLLAPYRRWVDTSRYAGMPPPGRIAGLLGSAPSREYGIQCSEGFLQVFLGPANARQHTTKSWSTHLPWTQWRHVRFSLYDTAGAHFWTQLEKDSRRAATKPRAALLPAFRCALGS